MGVIFTHDLTDDTGRLAVGTIELVTLLVHGVQNTPMNRFQPITYIRQGT